MDPSSQYRDEPPSSHMGSAFFNYSDEAWNLVFHDACWELLLIQIGQPSPSPEELNQIALHLFNLIYCLPSDRRNVCYPAHDFGGASRFWGHRDIDDDWAFLEAEPRVPSFKPRLNTQGDASHKPPVLPHADSSTDCFSRLPLDVVFAIVAALDSADLCNIRLASRTLAIYAAPATLPQSFWHSRFSRKKELGFLYGALSQKVICNGFVDWRELYTSVKAEMIDRSARGHLRNAGRIWRSLRHLTTCLNPLLEQSASLNTEDKTLDLHLETEGYVLGTTAGSDTRPEGKVVRQYNANGACVFREGRIFMNTVDSEASMRLLKVSLIVYNCVEYVCGIRYLRQCDPLEAREISRVGLIIISSEITLEIHPEDDLNGMEVATTASGIIGLSWNVSRNGSTIRLSAGIIDQLPQNAGLAHLMPRFSMRFVGFVAKSDACKFVAIQLVERPRGAGHGEEAVVSNRPPSISHLHRGHSKTVDISTLLSSLERNAVQKSSLFRVMNFETTDGSPLVRIVAFHNDADDCIRGFGLHFADGSSEAHGDTNIAVNAAEHWTCTEQTAAIDGPGGERIIGLEHILHSERGPDTRMKCVKFLTSRNRGLAFCSSPFQKKDDYRWVPVQCSTSSTRLLGMIGTFEVTIFTFGHPGEEKGTTTQEATEEGELVSSRVDPKDVKKSPRSPRQKCYTAAGLTDISQISISSGAPGKARTSSHISGLRLEYYSLSQPIYVGQWCNEISSLSFRRGEKIVGMTFWQTQETPPNVAAHQKENAGRIAGIRIIKFGFEDEPLEVFLDRKDSLFEYAFHENLYEDLTEIVWGFNHNIDYIHVKTRPSLSRPGSLLTLHDMRGLRPSDRFPGKLLWEVRDSDEKVSQVSRISMVFNRLKLVGIVCGYGQGLAQRSVGRTDGERQTMTLYNGELPCRFDFLLYGDEHAIVMYTDHNRKQAFFPSGSSPSLWEKPSEYFATRMLDGSSNSEGFDPNPQLKQPVSCVGIWVTMRIHEIGGKDIWDLGPLLLDAEYEEMNFARDMEQDEESR